MYFLYVLRSLKFTKSYVGISKNPQERLKEHNWGAQIYTKKHRPWVIIHLESFKDSIEARKREKYLKSAAGRRWMKKNVFK